MTTQQDRHEALIERNRNAPLDRRPDNRGLDDGPLLPANIIAGWKSAKAKELRGAGLDLRTIAVHLEVSHETIRVWTKGVNVRRGRKP